MKRETHHTSTKPLAIRSISPHTYCSTHTSHTQPDMTLLPSQPPASPHLHQHTTSRDSSCDIPAARTPHACRQAATALNGISPYHHSVDQSLKIHDIALYPHTPNMHIRLAILCESQPAHTSTCTAPTTSRYSFAIAPSLT